MPASGVFRMESKCFRQTLLIGFLLATVTLILYWPVQSFDFVYDDELYITNNRPVQGGLSLEGAKWSFTTFHAGNWHPLTWISHMADVEAHGLLAGSHHWTSVLIHAGSAVLLFFVLSIMTRSTWASTLVAALFALHPLHVESVAWISERKDVLSGLFWILTMGVYAYYVKRPTIGRYLLVLLSFVLGLLSKPMVVTLPFVLLLLDYWPLGRFAVANTAFDRWVLRSASSGQSAVLRLIIEKVPLLILVVPVCVIAFLAQGSAGALQSLDKLPVLERIANAAVSYLEYIWKMFRPVDLAVLYPHSGMPPAWKIVSAVLLIASISAIAVRKARELPFLLVGWLWYLGTLVPVIGIIQVGSQSMADRYTYLPLVGLFIAVSWGMKSIVERLAEMQTRDRRLDSHCTFGARVPYKGAGRDLEEQHNTFRSCTPGHGDQSRGAPQHRGVLPGSKRLSKGRAAFSASHPDEGKLCRSLSRAWSLRLARDPSGRCNALFREGAGNQSSIDEIPDRTGCLFHGAGKVRRGGGGFQPCPPD